MPNRNLSGGALTRVSVYAIALDMRIQELERENRQWQLLADLKTNLKYALGADNLGTRGYAGQRPKKCGELQGLRRAKKMLQEAFPELAGRRYSSVECGEGELLTEMGSDGTFRVAPYPK